jgi:hypothetical protein
MGRRRPTNRQHQTVTPTADALAILHSRGEETHAPPVRSALRLLGQRRTAR